MMKVIKVLGFGILNFLARFIIGGILFQGLGVDPSGFLFGFTLAIAALIFAYGLLRFVMRPQSVQEAVYIALIWAGLALLLDIVTAEPIVKVAVSYLLSQVQTWARVLVIIAVAPFTVATTRDAARPL